MSDFMKSVFGEVNLAAARRSVWRRGCSNAGSVLGKQMQSRADGEKAMKPLPAQPIRGPCLHPGPTQAGLQREPPRRLPSLDGTFKHPPALSGHLPLLTAEPLRVWMTALIISSPIKGTATGQGGEGLGDRDRAFISEHVFPECSLSGSLRR